MFVAIYFLCTSCSSIQLDDNCGKPEKIKISVLPFVNDEFNCHKNIEKKIRNLCYDIIDGEQLLNEYLISTSKQINNISIVEFCEFALSRGVDKIILGDVSIEWIEGPRPKEKILSSSNSQLGERSLEEQMYYITTGNYAKVTCYSIDTRSKEKQIIFKNYQVKKVSIGMYNPLLNLSN